MPLEESLRRNWGDHVSSKNIEDVRKHSQILIIDDQEWPHQQQLTHDRFHVTRWPDVEDTDALTDGRYALVLLDLHGVGLKLEPKRQGIGILDYIKNKNPAQLVIVYSAKPQSVEGAVTLARADAVMDKSCTYLEFREKIDRLLLRRTTPDYFVAAMNEALGADAAKVPKVVPIALKAFRTGKTDKLRGYLNKYLGDDELEELIAFIVRVGIKALAGI